LNIYKWKEKLLKEYSVVFLVEGKKVQVTKFAFEEFIFVVFCCEAETICNRKVVSYTVTNQCEELTSSKILIVYGTKS